MKNVNVNDTPLSLRDISPEGENPAARGLVMLVIAGMLVVGCTDQVVPGIEGAWRGETATGYEILMEVYYQEGRYQGTLYVVNDGVWEDPAVIEGAQEVSGREVFLSFTDPDGRRWYVKGTKSGSQSLVVVVSWYDPGTGLGGSVGDVMLVR